MANPGDRGSPIDVDDTLKAYYARRAPEYDEIYSREDARRQGELALMAERLQALVRGRTVLEVACGTAYWTRIAAATATRIVATDACPEVLARAHAMEAPPGKVEFLECDAYTPSKIPGTFDAAVTCFWLSHVPRKRVSGFLRDFHARIQPGSVVFLADNMLIDGFGGELILGPGSKDTFKRRKLADGSGYTILKNYYEREELTRALSAGTRGLDLCMERCYWWATYERI